MDDKNKPSRDDVKLQRQAKKLAKSSKKNKGGGPNDAAPSQPVAVPHSAEKLPEAAQTASPSVTSSQQVDKSAVATKTAVQEKIAGSSGKAEGRSKAELRAERRAKQEAQRAAKEGAKPVSVPSTGVTKPAQSAPSKTKDTPVAAKSPIKPSLKGPATAKATSHQPKLLSHLQSVSKPLPSLVYQNAHPAIADLGAKYEGRVVSGSNARCVALLQTLKKVIADFVTPEEKEFSRAMETRLNDSMAYLSSCRPSSVSMTNALKHVKSHLTQLTTEKISDDEARRKLTDVIDTFIKEQIDVAGEAICNAVANKIANGDTITIYGCSSLLFRILVQSHNEGKRFEVVIVDGGPLFEGREMCHRLLREKIQCTYVLLPAFSFIVRQTTKVLLGAHALLANGCVMSRSGSAVIAMVAKAHNVPVIVCCETYKFCERVQADAFVHNELGPHVTSVPPTISLKYDMTPPTLVDAVATELAILPCTSVPVVLRVKPSDITYY